VKPKKPAKPKTAKKRHPKPAKPKTKAAKSKKAARKTTKPTVRIPRAPRVYTERLDFRLTKQQKTKLIAAAKRQGTSVTAVVLGLVDKLK
jgi:hypothetical protein